MRFSEERSCRESVELSLNRGRESGRGREGEKERLLLINDVQGKHFSKSGCSLKWLVNSDKWH